MSLVFPFFPKQAHALLDNLPQERASKWDGRARVARRASDLLPLTLRKHLEMDGRKQTNRLQLYMLLKVEA